MARKALNAYDQGIVDSVPDAEEYPDKSTQDAIRELKSLPEKKQLKILRKLGVKPDKPLQITQETRSELLSVIAEVAFGIPSTKTGRRGQEIITPTGSGKKQ